MASAKGSLKVAVISLGCPKNIVDTEWIMGLLGEEGVQFCSEPEDADLILINTCAFIEPAVRETEEEIARAIKIKREAGVRIVVVGCYVSRFRQALKLRFPEVDRWMTWSDLFSAKSLIESLMSERKGPNGPFEYTFPQRAPRLVTTARMGYAFVKIADGCSHACTFCTIPKIKGPYKSRKIHEIVEEITSLRRMGVKEVILVSQDSNLYGKDIGENLCNLLEAILEKTDIPWIRILYMSPETFDERVLCIFKQSRRLLPYFDLPFQHASERVLRRMGRRGNAGEYLRLISNIRDVLGDCYMRSTFIVGFPGETEDDFCELLEFLRKSRIDNVGIFPFFPEPETPASRMDGQIPESEKLQRLKEAFSVQESVSRSLNRRLVGKTFTALVQGRGKRFFWGRIAKFAPEIDGIVIIKSKRELRLGEFCKVRINRFSSYDLGGEAV